MAIEPQQQRNLPWVEKYRPASLDDVVAQESVIRTIKKLVRSGNLPHLLFYGPAGTGKTSTVLALAREIFGDDYKSHVLELNASDERGIDVVRDNIKTFASSATLFSAVTAPKKAEAKNQEIVPTEQLKLIILDEADSMTSAAQFALRRVIEKYTKTTRFCFLCNSEQRIIPAIQSRCTRFRFKPIGLDAMCSLVQHVAVSEGFQVGAGDKLALEALARASEGDVRRALNILSALKTAKDTEDMSETGISTLTVEDVNRAAGLASPAILDSVMDAAWREATIGDIMLRMEAAMRSGASAVAIVNYCSDVVTRMGLPAKVKAYLLKGFAEADDNLQAGCSVRAQMLGVCGLFITARDMREFKMN